MSSDNFSVLGRLCQLGHGIAVLPVWHANYLSGLEAMETKNPSAAAELWMVSPTRPSG